MVCKHRPPAPGCHDEPVPCLRKPGSSADNAGLQQGDVILEVNRHKVQSPADVQQELSKVAQGQDALLLVWSNGGNSFRVLHYPEGA